MIFRAGILADSGATTTWNPSDKSADYTLSGGNLVATHSGSSLLYPLVRGTAGRSLSKLYFEARLGVASGQAAIGLADDTLSTGADQIIGSVGHSVGFWTHDYSLRINGSSVFSLGAGLFAFGDYARLAIDFTNNKIWVSKVGSSWNGSGSDDPATNTGGYSMAAAAMSGLVYPAATINVAAASWTLNCGQSAFQGAIPSGFGRWN